MTREFQLICRSERATHLRSVGVTLISRMLGVQSAQLPRKVVFFATQSPRFTTRSAMFRYSSFLPPSPPALSHTHHWRRRRRGDHMFLRGQHGGHLRRRHLPGLRDSHGPRMRVSGQFRVERHLHQRRHPRRRPGVIHVRSPRAFRAARWTRSVASPASRSPSRSR